MPSTLHHGRLAALPALLLLGACGTEIGAPPTLMTTEADRTMLPTFHNRDGCERVGLFRIRCPQQLFGDNITFTREVTFIDSLGNEMEFFDRDLTESIHLVTAFEGTRSRENLTVTINRDRDMVFSGLLGTETERTWNGTGNASANRTRLSDEHGDREYDLSSTTTISDVVHAFPRLGTWPLSGTITREITIVIVSETENAQTRTRTAVITFNGTQLATITVNGEPFTFDLETKTVVRDEEG